MEVDEILKDEIIDAILVSEECELSKEQLHNLKANLIINLWNPFAKMKPIKKRLKRRKY